MPEHDETDAPREQCTNHRDRCMVPGCDHVKYPSELDKRYPRKSKAERWGVEDKVVDGESK